MREFGLKLQSPKVQGLREEATLVAGLLGSSLGLRQAVAIGGRGGRGRAGGYLKCLLSWTYVPSWLYMVPEISKHIIMQAFPLGWALAEEAMWGTSKEEAWRLGWASWSVHLCAEAGSRLEMGQTFREVSTWEARTSPEKKSRGNTKDLQIPLTSLWRPLFRVTDHTKCSATSKHFWRKE